MAEVGKGTMMSETSCEWVREWLPLLASDVDAVSADQVELSTEERSRIEHHLSKCELCRKQRMAFDQMGLILSIAAVNDGVPADMLSVWPQLERRMQQHANRSSTHWLRIRRLVWTRMSALLIGQPRGEYGHLQSGFPLQIAWIRDTLGDFLVRRVQPAVSRMSYGLALSFQPTALGLRLGAGLAIAGLVIFLTAASIAHHHSKAAAQIAANAAPIPALASPLTETSAETEFSMTEVRTTDEVSIQPGLAQAEKIEAAETISITQAVSPRLPAPVPSTPTVGPTAPPASVSRYDFDLEHGTPMPPETRGGKPAY
jgi:hypothetical protein